ncbi:nuclear valosin-containing protein-like isoform X1 [Homarus americanus]|uniref:nuclear valosin-containing protein-like isoform X1 n=1 Tax=Homarus americanus TaxID=6706 RepID=UPI001C461489|nr:nuclear valosin-containing protein-like isoform X1 [Homarus americanus]
MKRPYFQERTLPDRVEKYISENNYVDVEDMTEYLINNYREFRGKNKKAFMKSVERAYEWQVYCHQQTEEDTDCVDLVDSDGGGADIMEINEPESPVKAKCLNTILKKMYKSPAPSCPSSAPKTLKGRDFFVLDNEGDQVNGARTPENSIKKKRKKDREGEIEDIIKKKKKKQLLPEESTITFAHMAGIESLKDKICDLVANLRWPGILQPLQKSVLITGPSGSGKTAFAKALAGTVESPILRVTATELVGGVSGESEERINEIFDQAASLAPCVLLIEKIDVIAPKEGNTKSLEKRIGTQMSSCLSNMKIKHKDKQVIVMGETSRPENLDWDLRSSFDGEIFMAIPTEATRAQILQLLCEGTSFAGDFEELAHRTPGYVAGDLKKLLEKAQSLAWKRKKDSLYGKTEGMSLMEQLRSFMNQFEEMCEAEEVNTMVTINMEDFMEALMHITPVLKREGFPTVPDVTWQDIGGLEDIKRELREKILEPIQFAKLHEEFGASRPNGILMWGPPGCGKTLLAKAVANEAGINLLPVMGPELLNMYQGESERAVREVFKRARNVSPCVIFFDEFDSLCPVRSKGAESGSKTTIVNTLLTEMNGFTKREDVYVIAATNRPDILDPAVTRPGRFDTLLYVDVPNHLGRVSIFQARTKNGTCPHLASDVNFEEVSLLCSSFSGADCDQLVYLASKEAIREVIHSSSTTTTSPTPVSNTPDVKRLVAKRHFSAALKKIKPSITLEEQRRYKKLYSKMEVSRVRGELPGFPEDISSLTENLEEQSQPLDVANQKI